MHSSVPLKRFEGSASAIELVVRPSAKATITRVAVERRTRSKSRLAIVAEYKPFRVRLAGQYPMLLSSAYRRSLTVLPWHTLLYR